MFICKMTSFVLTFALVCLLDPAVALRSQENLNVLVPNNDVNLQTKIKKLLNDDEVDREDFSENEIEKLSAIKNPKIDKFLGRKANTENKVFDDKNKNIEQNMIDYEPSLLRELSVDNVTSYPTEFSVTPTVPSLFTSNSSLSLPTTESIFFTTRNVTFSTTANNTNGSPIYSTPAVNVSSSLPILTPSSPMPTHNSSTTRQYFPSPPESSLLISTTTEASTTYKPIYNDLQPDECILGKPDKKILWADDEGSLNNNFIETNYGRDVRKADLSRKLITENRTSHEYNSLRFLSVAKNNLQKLPIDLLERSNTTLQYLSLNGNDFSAFAGKNRDMNFMRLPLLQELDLRNCRLETIRANFIKNLTNLTYLYLSNNPLKDIYGKPFPDNLLHIDLSYNSDVQSRLTVTRLAFSNLQNLRTLDFSHTKIETGSAEMLDHLPVTLVGLSLCYSDLPEVNGTFMLNARNLLYLDISGNLKLVTENTKFVQSLSVLFIRNSNLHHLKWTSNLIHLEFLDLYDNNINTVSNLSFSVMTSLVKLNLEKNSIGNWYERLFVQNRKLKFLNLRENKLSVLTNDMIEDLLSVKSIAIGHNNFECNCFLQNFIHGLIEATRVANVSNLNPFETVQVDNDNNEFIEKVSLDTTRATLGFRNHQRPEYDIISRTYQKYYQMVEKSVEALKIRTMQSKSMILTRKLITQTNNNQEISFDDTQTILFDYNDDDYECINATSKKEQPIIDLDSCERKEEMPPYNGDRTRLALSLYISIPLVAITSVLVVVVYWKWWYVRYFFVLCKNSAILTFMDDSESGKDAIVSSQNDESVDTFLYDVFVSYSESNRDWVLDEFISNVEKRESINVCLHERDFQVGYGILENIVSCMDRSRCLLLLVSENFLLSQWCQFEMNLAQHRLLETRRDKLILVLLEDIPVRKQPRTLKYLMRTKTYIKWPAEGSKEEKNLFWKRLKKSIISSKWETENYGSIV